MRGLRQYSEKQRSPNLRCMVSLKLRIGARWSFCDNSAARSSNGSLRSSKREILTRRLRMSSSAYFVDRKWKSRMVRRRQHPLLGDDPIQRRFVFLQLIQRHMQSADVCAATQGERAAIYQASRPGDLIQELGELPQLIDWHTKSAHVALGTPETR